MKTPSLILCELDDPGIRGLESYSPFCLKAHRALKAAHLPYARRHGAQPGSHRRVNPTGQVPVLLIDDSPVADSTAILRRILALKPDAFEASAEAWLWEELADSSLNGFLVAARWADARNWPATRDAYFARAPGLVRALVAPRIRARVVAGLVARDVWRAGAEACWSRFGQLLDQLEERAPELGFWCGRRLSVADLGLFAQAHSLRTPLTRWQADELARRKRLSAWLDRVHEETACVAPTASSGSFSGSAAAS